MKNIYLHVLVIVLLVSKLIFFDKKEEEKGAVATSIRTQNPIYLETSETEFLKSIEKENPRVGATRPDYRTDLIVKQQETINRLKGEQSQARTAEDTFWQANPAAMRKKILEDNRFLAVPSSSLPDPTASATLRVPLQGEIRNVFIPFYGSARSRSAGNEFRRDFLLFESSGDRSPDPRGRDFKILLNPSLRIH